MSANDLFIGVDFGFDKPTVVIGPRRLGKRADNLIRLVAFCQMNPGKRALFCNLSGRWVYWWDGSVLHQEEAQPRPVEIIYDECY